MTRHITVIQGHPDPRGDRFGRALLQAYVKGAREAGHEIRTIDVATLEFPLLRSQDDWKSKLPVPSIEEAQNAITWADHVVIFYPLWHGTMPALLKGFFEQVLRPGFAIGDRWQRLLKGRSARIVVTMGMPALVYRWYFRAHCLKNLKGILKLCGIGPIRTSLIGMVEGRAARREKWLSKIRAYGGNGT